MAFVKLKIEQGRPGVALDSGLNLKCRVDLSAIKIGGQTATRAALIAANGTNQIITVSAPASLIAEFADDGDSSSDTGILLAAFGADRLRFFTLSVQLHPNDYDISV